MNGGPSNEINYKSISSRRKFEQLKTSHRLKTPQLSVKSSWLAKTPLFPCETRLSHIKHLFDMLRDLN